MEQQIDKKQGELHAATYPPGSCVKVITLAKGRVLVVVSKYDIPLTHVDERQEMFVAS